MNIHHSQQLEAWSIKILKMQTSYKPYKSSELKLFTFSFLSDDDTPKLMLIMKVEGRLMPGNYFESRSFELLDSVSEGKCGSTYFLLNYLPVISLIVVVLFLLVRNRKHSKRRNQQTAQKERETKETSKPTKKKGKRQKAEGKNKKT